MLAICRVENPNHILYPGMYSQVKFATSRANATLLIPGDTVTMSRTGPRVAIVGTDGVVHFRDITIANDLGAEVEVAHGLNPGDLVISNPTDVIQDGVKVEVRKSGK
jgi:multidrug efflux pump subunit AcrA (membrane-fusion protein)